jgi:hypothetical protein
MRNVKVDVGKGLMSAQPNEGMQIRGDPANKRGINPDCCGIAALMTQSGRMTRQVPVGGSRSGCIAESK